MNATEMLFGDGRYGSGMLDHSEFLDRVRRILSENGPTKLGQLVADCRAEYSAEVRPFITDDAVEELLDENDGFGVTCDRDGRYCAWWYPHIR